MNRYGTAMGAEFAGKGVDVALGPTINIVRDPRWGRNFETYSEDPYLAGAAGTATIQGIQSQGVMAQAKHAAAYNVEAGASRGTPSDNVIVDDRTLHEIYLPAFQQVASQGQVASVMCAYNQINGVPACQNSAVLTTALKQDAAGAGSSAPTGVRRPAARGSWPTAGSTWRCPAARSSARACSTPSRAARSPRLAWTTWSGGC